MLKKNTPKATENASTFADFPDVNRAGVPLRKLYDLEAIIVELTLASYAMERLVEAELDSGRTEEFTLFPYRLTTEQADGVRYIVGHVRDLSLRLDKAFEAATERS